jgi:hypothetical protein
MSGRILAANVLQLVGRYAARARNAPSTSAVRRSAHDELVRVVQISEELGNTVRVYIP